MQQEKLKVIKQRQLTADVFELTLKGAMAKATTTAGQFVDVKIPDDRLLLRRPFGIAQIDPATSQLRLIYRTVGQGTTVLSHIASGAQLDTIGPLGHGFPTDFLQAGQRALIIGGGTGIPPLYALSRQLVTQGVTVTHAIGFGHREQIFYEKEFRELGTVHYATDDGSYGFHGHIGLLLDAEFATTEFDAVYACGPRGLLMAVNNRYRTHPHAYISLESRMACGVGECYACVVPAQNSTKLYKVCDDGPVFATGEVEI
ncbi:MAG: dihydroorotate dehydrogenase electron transfer subunit [Loigolactobacillus coryniformis]|jgi:dihydroorotate dehydrogenase electron transfer subunit|uniref:Dihydroorotate dehydrogenase B (NAD(+)), electron transfer subunit n=2 Tax=Loigolactobacillus coryniformis TaxID=1610 RepID=J3JBA8_9LACO|nr:dihydroorotate dehydrogenase electron transfer subunit [Loigolactobacillus coryniformis]ATO43841.1 dihydroorotate dehydrogenase electron transfer subunit [Loigolactobacillus coryniformis subsp. torquens DSM 20004 = KCTC 3535]EJN55567.1 Dihydroorotate dehydrogenase electron transfer subunit [Loigolactobacillus coryniformis subsp. coryniformis CECT 5711]KRK82797.1 dihydroorotate oxidase, electron transfer subunit [Loigolactobacillus coryniformis subsp. torquens DSM 20004 = KCTC 3535]MDN5951388